MELTTTELRPYYDTRVSFYGKAMIAYEEGKKYLFSYETAVAEINRIEGEKIAFVYDWYSSTTTRHINEFLQQNGFRPLSKKEMEGGTELWGE